MTKYECNLTLGSLFIQMQAEHGKDPVMKASGPMTANQMAGTNAIMQVLRCLSLDRMIDATFNPTYDEAAGNEIVKCRWERSGNLKLIGTVTGTYMHALSIEEAIQRIRIFTCPRHLFDRLPKKRQGKPRE